jgi:hypothetical protein
MKFNLTIIFCAMIISAAFFVKPSYALNSNTGAVNNAPVNQPAGSATNTSGTGPSQTILDFQKPVKGDLGSILNRVVNILITLIASVSIIFIIIGGFRLAFSQGQSEAVTAGKKTITWAIIGLVMAMLAFAIVRIVFKLLY